MVISSLMLESDSKDDRLSSILLVWLMMPIVRSANMEQRTNITTVQQTK
jgi:hypothetical protein